MCRKIEFCTALIVVFVLGLSFVLYGMPDRYVLYADEMAIHIALFFLIIAVVPVLREDGDFQLRVHTYIGRGRLRICKIFIFYLHTFMEWIIIER